MSRRRPTCLALRIRWSRVTLRRSLAGASTAVLLAFGAAGASLAAESGPSRQAAAWRAKVDPWVLQTVDRYGVTDFFAYLDAQADLGAAARLRTKEEKGRFVFETLSATAERTQRDLLAALTERGIEHRSYWVANMVWVRGGLDTVEALAARPEVRRLAANPKVARERLVEQVKAGVTNGVTNGPSADAAAATAAAGSVGPSIAHTGASNEFWANGFAGQGVVVAGADTGYDWRHQALISSYRGWDGDTADHNYNWHDAIHSGGGSCGPDSREPCDDGRHGTHTMGTMVGDDGAANQIGMAPGARWIGCRNMDEGVGSPATYSECFQWFIAPTDLDGNVPDPSKAPDVINNSWSCPEFEGCTDPGVLRTVVENTRAAGILVVASAGNGGPSCSSIDTPIAIYDAVLTVGATDVTDEIAGFSSKGSVSVDGSNRSKPDLVAPGVSVRSSVPGDAYSSFNGTSMSGPHVAGMAALVLSAAPCTSGRPRRLESHLLDSALPRPEALCSEASPHSVPNQTYGFGALRAVLPACHRDGRVAGLTSRLETSKVVCRNKATGDKAKIKPDGLNMWNCMGRGLDASAGDSVLLKLTGAARELGELRGEVFGLEAKRVVCKNKSTGRRIKMALGGKQKWSCEDAGLEVAGGDRLRITVLGKAEADS